MLIVFFWIMAGVYFSFAGHIWVVPKRICLLSLCLPLIEQLWSHAGIYGIDKDPGMCSYLLHGNSLTLNCPKNLGDFSRRVTKKIWDPFNSHFHFQIPRRQFL